MSWKSQILLKILPNLMCSYNSTLHRNTVKHTACEEQKYIEFAPVRQVQFTKKKVCVHSRILGEQANTAGIKAKFPTTCLSLVCVHKCGSVHCDSQHHATACDALSQFLLNGRRTPYHHEKVDFHPRNWKEQKPQWIQKMTYWSGCTYWLFPNDF